MYRPAKSLLASAVGITVLLSGCAASAEDTAEAEDAPPTCAEFNAADDQVKEQLLKSRIGYSSYTSERAKIYSPMEAYTQVCAEASNEETALSDVDFPESDPTCSTFSELQKEELREEWIEVLREEEYFPTQAIEWGPEDFEERCSGFSAAADHLVRVANSTYDFASVMTWEQETPTGYKTGTGFALYGIQTGDNFHHPASDDSSFDEVCSYDPETDALLPYVLSVTDRTDSMAATREVNAGFRVEPRSLTQTPVIQANVASNYSDDSECTAVGEHVVVNWEELEPGEESWHTGFIVLTNWMTPKHPNGAKNELSSYVIAPVAQAIEGDGLPSLTPWSRKMTLDGEVTD